MSLLFISPNRNLTPWKDAVEVSDPNIDVEIWPNVEDKERVQFAVCWNHPEHVLDQYPNLQAVSSLGAGVDHLLADENLPESVDICRVVSPSLVQQMKEYVLAAVLSIQRNLVTYARQKESQDWSLHSHHIAKELSVGVMGLGELGKPVARQLSEVGYQVSGWSRSAKELEGVQCFAGRGELNDFLNTAQLLVCLLPLTEETSGILALDLFKQLEQPAWIINVARGGHLVDEDLIYALDSGLLEGAWLDVFSEEPLPDRHPFWNRPNIMITPHVASITKADEVAEQLADNYKRVLSGIELKHKVDRSKGY